MEGRRSRAALRRGVRAVALGALFCLLGGGRDARATFRYGDIQISGNISSQALFRLQHGSATFNRFDPVQERNTFRLQYEHQLVKDGNLLNGFAHLPGIENVNFFSYYRFVYDSIYDIAPGTSLRTQDDSFAGRLSDLPGRERHNVAFENVLREIFVDIKTRSPVSFRIGRQQIVWGEALSFRALDSVNALDLSWHAQQEAGLLGKVGFDELRIPAWTVKMLVDIGSFGPLSNQYLEAFDIPFDFQPAFARFMPDSPWSIPVRNPIRAGLVVDGSAAANLPAGTLLLQPCFDLTGNAAANANQVNNPGGADVDFSNTATTGVCNTRNRQITRIEQGLYDKRDPFDANQVGARYGANAYGVGFTLNYIYRRHLGADIPGAGILRTPIATFNGNTAGYVQPSPHTTTDPITRQTQSVSGYVRIPAEFYYPYVHVFGASANYFEEYTGAVWALEGAYTKGLPISTTATNAYTTVKKDVLLGAASFDRPTWIRFLNPRSTWLIIGQLDYNLIFDHNDSLTGLPNTKAIPRLTDDHPRIDKLKKFEFLSLLVASTFYRGGSFAPLLGWVSDWANAPSMEFIAAFDYLPSNNLIITPALRIFTNFGRNVDEPWGVGRFSQNDEFQMKVTYQF